jgi:hypothetical protein
MSTLDLDKIKSVDGEFYGTPKELWGFREKCKRGTPNQIARRFLRPNASLLGLDSILRTLKQRAVIRSLGATHVVLQQQYNGVPIHRAFITVHFSRDNYVYLLKNRAVPSHLLGGEPEFTITKARARKRALRAVGISENSARVIRVEKRWFPVRASLRPALRVRVQRRVPREDWIVYVDARNARILSQYNNLSKVRGEADVFDPNPVIALGDYRELLDDDGHPIAPPIETYARVALRDLNGNGRLDGKRVTTKLTSRRVKSPDHSFLYWSDQRGFDEAMVYYHIDEAIRYLERLGYRNSRTIFTGPLPVDAHATSKDQSWYDPGTKSLSFGTGGVDDAEDAETILHEFGHALQDAICPDFGQSYEAAAMGEGFGDYFAASYFAHKKRKPYLASVMSWDAITYDDYDPPCLRRLDEAFTYDDFDDQEGFEHNNGSIWAATLWDVLKALGRSLSDPIIIESHFQLDGFTTFARGARAILDADRNLNRGKNVGRLKSIFAVRRIGPVD